MGLVILQARYGVRAHDLDRPVCMLVHYQEAWEQMLAAHREKKQKKKKGTQPDLLKNVDQPIANAEADCLDVTVSLQFMVNQSQLHLSGASHLGSMLGWYAPTQLLGSTGDDATDVLYIKYLYGGHEHRVVVSEGQSLSLPNPAHRV